MIKRLFTGGAVVAAFLALTLGGCRSTGSTLENDTDSLSYVIGLNVAKNLMAMDSTLNPEAVCMAIVDLYDGKPRMTMDEARTYLLAQKVYFVHEKAMAYQERFLADLSKHDRSFVRTRKGVTYRIDSLGDQGIQSMSVRDTIRLTWVVSDESGRRYIDGDTVRMAYRRFPDGIQELIRIGGEGAVFEAWLPSKEAYDADGVDSLGIAPHLMLNFKVRILDIDYNNEKARRRR